MKNDVLSSLNSEQQSWLIDPHSLTRRLRDHAGNAVTFHLFEDGWGAASDGLRDGLCLEPAERTWIRRIEFRCDGVAWISAVVVIPESSITADTVALSQAGNRPIGEILFQDPTLSRSEFTFCKIAHQHFSRRSILHYKQQPLLIEEIFFPAFFEKIITCKAK